MKEGDARVFLENVECELAHPSSNPEDLQHFACFESDEVTVQEILHEWVIFKFVDYRLMLGSQRPMIMQRYIFEANTITKREYDRRFLEGLIDNG